jgi:hypothetical protein
MTPCQLVKRCLRFDGLADTIFKVHIVEEFSPWTLYTLKIVLLRSSETSVTVYYSTCRSIPECINIHERFRVNLRFRNNKQFQLR